MMKLYQKLKKYLSDSKKLDEMRRLGLEWAKGTVTDVYINNIVDICKRKIQIRKYM